MLHLSFLCDYTVDVEVFYSPWCQRQILDVTYYHSYKSAICYQIDFDLQRSVIEHETFCFTF